MKIALPGGKKSRDEFTPISRWANFWRKVHQRRGVITVYLLPLAFGRAA